VEETISLFTAIRGFSPFWTIEHSRETTPTGDANA
jgi:hypothetical protein